MRMQMLKTTTRRASGRARVWRRAGGTRHCARRPRTQPGRPPILRAREGHERQFGSASMSEMEVVVAVGLGVGKCTRLRMMMRDRVEGDRPTPCDGTTRTRMAGDRCQTKRRTMKVVEDANTLLTWTCVAGGGTEDPSGGETTTRTTRTHGTAQAEPADRNRGPLDAVG